MAACTTVKEQQCKVLSFFVLRVLPGVSWTYLSRIRASAGPAVVSPRTATMSSRNGFANAITAEPAACIMHARFMQRVVSQTDSKGSLFKKRVITVKVKKDVFRTSNVF